MMRKYESYNPVSGLWELPKLEDVALHAELNAMSIVPEPSAMLLMLSGLAGLAWLGRSK
jgi:hypothetical protein